MTALLALAVSCSSPSAAPCEGVDVSHFQGTVAWDSVRAGGVHFAYVKATDGAAETDPRFDENWSGTRAAGVVRGAYHFFRPGEDAVAQADHFLATVRFEPGDLPPALDVELTGGVSPDSIRAGVRAWLERVEAHVGARPVLYSDHAFLAAHLAEGFGRYPLWIADYADSTPRLPEAWQAWTFWQYSPAGRVPGVGAAVDRSRFGGSQAEWERARLRHAEPGSP